MIHPTHMPQDIEKSMESIAHLIQTVHKLRAPGGCPWDRAQTHQSLRQYLIEEAYEVLDVLDQIQTPEDLRVEKIKLSFKEELGDLLMQVLLHSEMTNEIGAFNIHDVAKTLDEKLIRRHPHVFGEQKADSADQAFQRWEKEKAKEKNSDPNASILDGLPKGLPALQKASRVIEKVTKVGFEWKDLQGPIAKIQEEVSELNQELQNFARHDAPSAEARQRVEEELGDVFFTLCNVAHMLKINPESSLRGTIDRFQKRFRFVEKSLKLQGRKPEESTLEEMDRYWEEAKKMEKIQVWGLTGGIGSGKTTVGQFLSELGIPVIDADQIARKVRTENPEVAAAIQKKFGTVNPAELKQLIFRNPGAKKDLEDIVHPYIRSESQRQIEKAASNSRVIVYEATLLVETGRFRDFTGLIVVTAPEELRKKRIGTRDQLSLELIGEAFSSQATDDERKKYADITIDNSGSLSDLKNRVAQVVKEKGWT